MAKRTKVYDLQFNSLLELLEYIEVNSTSSWKEYLLNELSVEPLPFTPLAPVRFNLKKLQGKISLVEHVLKEAFPHIKSKDLIHEITIPVLNLFMNFQERASEEKLIFQGYKTKLEQLMNSLEKSNELITKVDNLSFLTKRLTDKAILQTTHMNIVVLQEKLKKEISAIKKTKESNTLLTSVNALYEVFYRNLPASNKGKKSVPLISKWPYELDSSLKNELQNKVFEPKIFCLILIDQIIKMLNIDKSITVSSLKNLKQKNKKPERVYFNRTQFENKGGRFKKRIPLLRGSLPKYDLDIIIKKIFAQIDKDPIDIDQKISTLSKFYMQSVSSYLEHNLALQIAKTSPTGNRSALISIGLRIAEIENFKSGFAAKEVKEK